jgi:prepilin-type N-terminal cleavage/methylation domain-containing protein/prepilin-type processing-associated H-X9-DG protein
MQWKQGFTLIELLVVVAIMALLISILLPSLSAARAEARATVCATNQRHVGTAVAIYLNREGVFPVSYAYLDKKGRADVSPQAQQTNGPSPPKFGYVHWTWFLYSNGMVNDSAFQCPDFDKGGAPRTNPGKNQGDWEGGQVDDLGNTGVNTDREDLQAPRVAYMANAAVMPRNKFTNVLSGGVRYNKLIGEGDIRNAGKVIMAAEIINNWEAVAEVQAGGQLLKSKSHRPVNPFYNLSSGSNEYAAPNSASGRSGFVYGDPSAEEYGIIEYKQALQMKGLITNPGVYELNAVGRHHPGGEKTYGGTGNFLYVDTHVERKTVLETIKTKEWGNKYYTLSGNNKIEENK